LSLRRWLKLGQAMSKVELLKALLDERADLDAMLAELSDAQMTLPGVQDDWSVKDILAHISVWDRRGTKWIKKAAQGVMPEIPEAGLTWRDMDSLNQQTYLKNKDRPLAEIMGDFYGSHQELLEQIQGLPDAVVNKPIIGELISWRYNHYRVHGHHIRVWLANEEQGV